MNRLTDKEKQVKLFDTQILFEDEIKTYWIKPDVGEENIALKRNYYEAINKLGQLEDVEDELGIDLITLFKALKNGIYIKKQSQTKYPLALLRTHYSNNTTRYYVFDNGKKKEIKLKNYGKTWALTKEELE